MKTSSQLSLGLLASLACALSANATVIVNDTWADGSRNEQNLPTESRWFAANRASNFVASANALTFYTDPTGSRAGLTYFTPSGSPVSLNDGEGLLATLVFTPNTIGTANTSGNMRFGLVDYSGGTRLTADGTSSSMNGAGVTGYAVFMPITPTFGNSSPLNILQRTNAPATDLLGTGAAWETLGSGGGVNSGDPGYVSGTQYTLTMLVARAGSAANITTTVTGQGLSLSQTVTDPAGTFTFDGFAIRNSRGDQTAASFAFSSFTVETVIVPEPSVVGLAGLGLLALAAGRRWLRA
jgi:hypothetical protein